MARRPENPKSRGQRPQVPLDWLDDPAPPPAPPSAHSGPGQDSLLGRSPLTPAAARAPVAPTGTGTGQLSRRAARAKREGTATTATGALPPGPAAATADPGPVMVRGRQADPDEAADDLDPTSPRRGGWGSATWLTLVALALVLWSAGSFIDSSEFVIAGMTSLAPLATVFALPVIAIGVGRRHLVPTVIAVAAAMVPWVMVISYVSAGPGRTAIGAHKTFRVMSVDGAQGRASAKGIVQLAQTYSADIVVVTQLTSELAHQLTVAGLTGQTPAQWVAVPAGGTDGIGVWSGPKISNLQQINNLSRLAVAGVIQTDTGPVGITVVQLAGAPLHRASSWHTDLVRLAQRTPTTTPGLIVGDLNATPWQPSFRKLTASGWTDAADVLGQGLRSTWPSWSLIPLAPLDHVLVSRGLGVSSADTPRVGGSDHRALIVTVVLPKGGGD